jgi:hypothetical protein
LRQLSTITEPTTPTTKVPVGPARAVTTVSTGTVDRASASIGRA